MTWFRSGDRVFDESDGRAGEYHVSWMAGVPSVIYDDQPGVYTLLDEEMQLVHECDRSISWGDLARFDHAQQVRVFGWCSCEDCEPGGQPYEDCPKREQGGVFTR